MCWQWCGMTSSVETVVPSSMAGGDSPRCLPFFCSRWRMALRASACSARSRSASLPGARGGTRSLPCVTKLETAWQQTSGSAGRSPRRSMATVTPTSMDVRQAWCTLAVNVTTSPTRAVLTKCTSSILAVTQFAPA